MEEVTLTGFCSTEFRMRDERGSTRMETRKLRMRVVRLCNGEVLRCQLPIPTWNRMARLRWQHLPLGHSARQYQKEGIRFRLGD